MASAGDEVMEDLDTSIPVEDSLYHSTKAESTGMHDLAI